MNNIYFDSRRSDDNRRNALHKGDIFIYSPSRAGAQLCALAEHMLNEAVAPHGVRTIDYHLSMERMRSDFGVIKAGVYSSS